MIRKDQHKPTGVLASGRYAPGSDVKLSHYDVIRLTCLSPSRSDKLLLTEHVAGQAFLTVPYLNSTDTSVLSYMKFAL
jgi:hypothetical protein